MAKSKIECTMETWNPIAGCNDVSEGCRNCYARGMAKRLEAMGQEKYRGLTVLQGSKTVWTGKISFDEKALMAPLARKKPTTYFVNSMSDFFHPNVTDEQRDKMCAVMALCPQHTFQVLTKRPEYGEDYVDGRSEPGCDGMRGVLIEGMTQHIYSQLHPEEDRDHISMWLAVPWPLPNVWWGTSVESEKYKTRIDSLRRMAAAVRFLSCEPLLEDLGDVNLEGIHWVIAGGESGHNARPMHPVWAMNLRDQCDDANVPYFFKQWGEWTPGENVERTSGIVKTASWFDGKWTYGVENLANDEVHRDDEPDLYRVGKKAAGHFLDGREYQTMPRMK